MAIMRNAGWGMDGSFTCDQTHDCPFLRYITEERDELQTQFDVAMQVIEENNLMPRFEDMLK